MKMKNKGEKQTAAKKKHLEEISNKKRQRFNSSNLSRPSPSKVKKPTILIVCEGRNTEPSYFRQFKLSSATIVTFGEGYNTNSLIKRALALTVDKEYDLIWCVFDADPTRNKGKQLQNFNDAIKLAERYGFNAAYSNQAFEYWLILHFEDHQGGKMPRDQYRAKLNEYLQPYRLTYDGQGSKEVTAELFKLLWEIIDTKRNKTRTDLAIERAKRNYDRFDHSNPGKEESSTTVHKLVEELLKYM